MLTLRAGRAAVAVAPDAGGRIAQLTVAGADLLVPYGPRTLDWGLYPMVPFAGRLARGRFEFRGEIHELPLSLPPHAIHGTVLNRDWDVIDVTPTTAVLAVALGWPWPYPGRVEHRLSLTDHGLAATLVVEADKPMPVTVGWHPWWQRRLSDGRALTLEFGADAMYERGDDGLPTGRLVPPTSGPWDDCFTALHGPPVLRWSGDRTDGPTAGDDLTVVVSSTADHLVIYDHPPHAICVEPQTGPPDALNLGRYQVAEPGSPVTATVSFSWG